MGNETVKVKEEMTASPQELLDETCINTMRFLAVDAVEKANSGHPGMPMGDALMAYVLWTGFLPILYRSLRGSAQDLHDEREARV